MREWLVTNGLGGYASLTNMHSNTRKFHGILIASLNPPVDRWVFVSNCYDQIVSGKESYSLNPAHATFSFSLFPMLTYANDVCVLQKTFFMHHQHNTSIIKYDVLPKKPVTIRHYPLMTSRHFYDVHPEPSMFDIKIQQANEKIIFSPTNINQNITLYTPHLRYNMDYRWEYQRYEKDQQRNDAYEDHVLNVGYLEKEIREPFTYYLVFSLEDESYDPKDLFEQEKQRKLNLIKQSQLPSDSAPLILSSDQFLVKKGKRTTILAGYHWFSDWGRDTLLALPGLTLVTKRFLIARDILSCLQDTCYKGIIPNTYNDKTGDAAYNTVDASLWFIDRVFQYMKYTNDIDFLKNIYPTMESIISYYKNGTLNNIHMDNDYLISHDPGLTWMDVKQGDYYPTPRSKKAVEIQALWYHDLCIMDIFAHLLGKSNEYGILSENIKESFIDQYKEQYDVIDTLDTSCRPNKLFLVSLDHVMIDKGMQKDIVSNVLDQLITVFGPRTVSRDHSQYKGSYFGNYPRDITYHNGIVWPWLLGPFISAYVKTQGHSEQSRKQAYDQFLKPMFDVYGEQWDGSIHEIFDGDPVFEPRGCINQAWSVAEPLRAYIEDILLLKPPFEKKYQLNEISV